MTKKINDNLQVLGEVSATKVKVGGSIPLYRSAISLVVGETVNLNDIFYIEKTDNTDSSNEGLYRAVFATRTYDGVLNNLVGRCFKLDPQLSTWSASNKYAVGDVVVYSGAIFRCMAGGTTVGNTPLVDSGFWNKILQGVGTDAAASVVKVTGQTIETGTVAYDPVVFNYLTQKWEKQSVSNSSAMGFYAGVVGEIILFGKVTVVGFTPGMYYYQDPTTFSLTTTKNPTKIGFATSATDFFVDIDIEVSSQSNANVLNPANAASYILGGNTYGTRVETLLHSNEVMTNLGDILATASFYSGGIQSSFRGYSYGSINSPYTQVEGVIFSSNTTFNLGNILQYQMQMCFGSINSTIKGLNNIGTSINSNANGWIGILFSNETSYYSSNTLAYNIIEATGVSSSSKGYISGGYDGAIRNYIQDFIFSTELSSLLSATLTTQRIDSCGFNSSTKGFWAGGKNTLSVYTTDIDGIDFSTESAINPVSALSVAKSASTGTNSLSKGYITGGADAGTAYTTNEAFSFGDNTITTISAVLSFKENNSTGVQSGGSL